MVFFQEQRGVDTFAIRARQHASPALLHRLELFHRRWLDRVSLGAMVTTKQREQRTGRYHGEYDFLHFAFLIIHFTRSPTPSLANFPTQRLD